MLTWCIVCCQPSIVRACRYLFIRRKPNAMLCQIVPREGVHSSYVVRSPVHCDGLTDLDLFWGKLMPGRPRNLMPLQQYTLQITKPSIYILRHQSLSLRSTVTLGQKTTDACAIRGLLSATCSLAQEVGHGESVESVQRPESARLYTSCDAHHKCSLRSLSC